MCIDSEIIYSMEILQVKRERADFTDKMELLLGVGIQSIGWKNRIVEKILWQEYFRSCYLF